MLRWRAGPAGHRRRLGATLVRQGRGLDGLRDVPIPGRPWCRVGCRPWSTPRCRTTRNWPCSGSRRSRSFAVPQDLRPADDGRAARRGVVVVELRDADGDRPDRARRRSRRPSISTTPAISPIVPVQNTSSAVYISVSETSRTSTGMPADERERQDRRSGDALRTGDRARRGQRAVDDGEKVRRVRLGDEPATVEHQRVVGPGDVRLHLGEDRVEQVVVVDLRVEDVRTRPAGARGDQPQTGRVVHRRLVFRQHDQRAAGLVEPRDPCRWSP